jgi:ABC-type transport system substrate-binding protein
MRVRVWGLASVVAALGLIHCTNNPYPDEDATGKIRYRALPEPPKTLDPAVSYSSLEHQINANVYETLLEYHYLKRPYTLMPGLAESVPQPESLRDGGVAYRFRLRPGMRFAQDPCFELGGEGRTTREIVAADVAFELMRIADPKVTSPVVSTFAKIRGFAAFSQRLTELREKDEAFGERRIDEQYAAAGGITGLVVRDHELQVVLDAPYPQLLYWFAMPFTAPVPWEAVQYYDGQDGRDFFKDHPVSTGPYQITVYDKRHRIVLERNANWYGALYPEWKAPGAVYPAAGEPGDAEAGYLDPAYVGKPLPFLDRIEFRLEKESIPTFNKFLQGYYDAGGVIRESFDKVVSEGRLSPEMAARGMELVKSVDPDVFYMGFNMADPVVGSKGGDRSRKLRQAMCLAVDVDEFKRVFNNGRGVLANSPVPPGIFGYDASYSNPYRGPDVARAQQLLAEAGYPGGIDPETGAPLKLTFDVGDTSTRTRVQMQYWVDAWKQIGLDVSIEATDYNRFREKTREGSYQIFQWGWIADYPDPENFLFLLYGENASRRNPGAPNTANFENERYDALFREMKDLPNGERRLALIREMQAILEEERPWIELFHREAYALYHEWMHNVKPAGISFPVAKYVDIDPEIRAERRRAWNRPIRWPAYALAAMGVGVAIPGILTFFRERQ